MARFTDRRRPRPRHSDIQAELTGLVFDGVKPTILLGAVGMTVATFLLGRYYLDTVLIVFSAFMGLISGCRFSIAHMFNRKPRGGLTSEAAQRWELSYGLITMLYCSALAVTTLYCFTHHDDLAKSWCTVGTFAVCSGISGRLSLRPWIAQTCGLIMLTALTIALLMSRQPMVRLTAVMILMYAYQYCESISVKFAVVVDQIRVRRQLAVLAQHDSLTGLANRRQFEAQLEAACKQDRPFAILYIDLDKFKAVNDTFGHATGDALLRDVAQRLREAVRSTDLVARLGGDEFAILQWSPLTEESTRDLASRITREVALPFDLHGHTLQIGASIGVRISATKDADAEVLLRNADSALYSVKREGGGGYSLIRQEHPVSN